MESVNRHGGGRLPRSAAGVVYGAVLAFAQTDLKRLVAYSRA
ncbi:MAG TPA: proton-conducting transporter membrane subunit [Thermoanaerobaculia bacterium]